MAVSSLRAVYHSLLSTVRAVYHSLVTCCAGGDTGDSQGDLEERTRLLSEDTQR